MLTYTEFMTISLAAFSLGISVFALFLAYKASTLAKRQHDWQAAQSSFRAYFETEQHSNEPSFLKIHGITDQELSEHDLTADEFRQYMMVVNKIWHIRLTARRYARLRNKVFESYEDGVSDIIRKCLWLSPGTQSHRVVCSEQFQQSWNLVRRFWTHDTEFNTPMLVDATIKHFGVMDYAQLVRCMRSTPGPTPLASGDSSDEGS